MNPFVSTVVVADIRPGTFAIKREKLESACVYKAV
jgi:hypothetical protein